MSDFVHLHVHSEYSLLDGLANVGGLARRAAELRQPAIAITDHGNMSGVVQFHDACLREGVRPIIGCEIYTTVRDTVQADRDENLRDYHLTLLAQDAVGYRNLNEMVTEANTVGFHRRPKVWPDLLARLSKGIICLSGCLGGGIQQSLRVGMFNEAYLRASWLKGVFGDRFFFEVQDHGIAEQTQVIASLMEFSRLLDTPIVATNDSHFVHRSDSPAHELLLALQTRTLWSDPKRWVFPGERSAYYVKSGAEMSAVFPDHPEWLLQSRAIAERCDVRLDAARQEFPRPANVPHGKGEVSALFEMTMRGLAERGMHMDDGALDRAQMELDMIESTGYVRYFLIVADLCRWAKERGIRSSARGSVAGSLVAYALGIAPVDPIRFGLSFERFLNPGRKPDIDLDFADDRRREVFRYLADTYGTGNVAGIIAFSHLYGRSVTRDVGRVYGIQAGIINDVASSIPVGATIRDMMARDSSFASRVESTHWLKAALHLEGTIRHSSVHAAGVVISGSPLVDRVALIRTAGSDLPIVGVEMGDAERLGLVKFDLLGLKTLSLVERTVTLVEQTTGERINVDALPDGDPTAYRVLGTGDTVGVFQLEGAGMRKYLIDLQPKTLDHVQAMVALYRPGPLAEIPRYIRRRHGKESVEYPHAILEPILKDTYGIFVYQESLMEMAQQIVGMTPGESDKFLYAVRKKHPEQLAHYEPIFREAFLSRGVPADTFKRIWASLLPFGDYGFNKAHAACYGALAYVTAWLKGRHPACFYAALLSTETGDKSRTSLILSTAMRAGVRILPPCVNKSGVSFTVEDGAIRFGLEAIVNIGSIAASGIVAVRGDRPFQSVAEFRARVSGRVVNVRGQRSLALARAFDSLASPQSVLAGLGDTRTCTDEDLLDMEREVLGVTVSAPDARMVRLDTAGRTHLIGEVIQRHEDGMVGEPVVVGGTLVEAKRGRTRGGKPMCHITLEDETGSVRGVAFAEVTERDTLALKAGAMVVVAADVQSYMDAVSLLVKKVVAVTPSLDMRQPRLID